MKTPLWKRFVDKSAVREIIRERVDRSTNKPIPPECNLDDLRAEHAEKVSREIDANLERMNGGAA